MRTFAPHLFECPACTLISADFPADVSIYNESYMEKYRSYENEPLTRELMAARWGLMSRYLNGHRTLLDLGTGTGTFLRSPAAPEGLELHGNDINPGSPYFGGAVQLFVRKKSVDVLTMFDVVEHLPAPREVLEDLRPRLLVVNTPNIGALESPDPEIFAWKHYRPGEHLHYFSRTSLSALFLHAGYCVEEVSFTEGAKRNPDRPMDLITMIGRRAA